MEGKIIWGLILIVSVWQCYERNKVVQELESRKDLSEAEAIKLERFRKIRKHTIFLTVGSFCVFAGQFFCLKV